MSSLRKRILTALRIGIGIGLLVYLGVSGLIDWAALLGLFVSWPLTLAALALMLLGITGMAWRLCVLLEPHDMHLSLAASLRLSLIGAFFNTCLPGASGGDAVKIYYGAAGNYGRRTEVATIMVFDRVVGMISLLLWPVLVAPLFIALLGTSPLLVGLLAASALFALGLVGGLVLVLFEPVRNSRLFAWLFRRLPLGHYVERIVATVHGYRHRPGALAAALLISLATHTLLVAVALLLAEAISPAGAAWRMSMLIPLGFVANALPVTPGGLGVGEAAFDRLFTAAGLAGGAEVLLGWRLLFLLISLSGLGFYLQGSQRFIHAAAPVAALERKQPA